MPTSTQKNVWAQKTILLIWNGSANAQTNSTNKKYLNTFNSFTNNEKHL